MFLNILFNFLNYAFYFKRTIKRRSRFEGYVYPYRHFKNSMVWIFFDKHNKVYFAEFNLETLPCSINEELVLRDGKQIYVEFDFTKDFKYEVIRNVDVKTFYFYDPYLEEIMKHSVE
jgi:hypothetical protein